PRRELPKPDLDRLKQIGHKPAPGSPLGWPMFSSHTPGAAPWPVDQEEAELLLADLPKAAAFARLAGAQEGMFDDHDAEEVPIYPASHQPGQPLRMEDVEWRKLIPPAPSLPIPVSLAESERSA